jgi:NAD(P)-dependent dehydrogenase (short-subunit alcohol dehydrogenase family)
MKSILISGASSGIGRATALRLDRLGMQVFAGVREPADGDALAGQASDRLHPLIFDVRDAAGISRAVHEVAESVGEDGLTGLVNGAGEGFPGPLEIVPLDQIREQLEVNVIGQIALTRAALPLLRLGRGRIVFVGSVGGRVAFRFAGPYHASKYAIEAVGDCWRQELQPEGIAVSIVQPGPIATPIWGKGAERVDDLLADQSPAVDRYRGALISFRKSLSSADEKGGSPDKVAAVIEKALTADRPSTRYPVGGVVRFTTAVRPLVPDRLFDRIAQLVTK